MGAAWGEILNRGGTAAWLPYGNTSACKNKWRYLRMQEGEREGIKWWRWIRRSVWKPSWVWECRRERTSRLWAVSKVTRELRVSSTSSQRASHRSPRWTCAHTSKHKLLLNLERRRREENISTQTARSVARELIRFTALSAGTVKPSTATSAGRTALLTASIPFNRLGNYANSS